MTSNHTKSALDELIDIGRTENFHKIHQWHFQTPKNAQREIFERNFQEWKNICINYESKDIEYLIRAITILENIIPELCYGSVSPIFPLYNYLIDSTQNDYSELSNWIKIHANNNWVAHGYFPATYAKMIEDAARSAKEHTEQCARDEALRQAKALEREIRKKNRQEIATSRQQKKRQERESILSAMENLQPIERLEKLASDTDHPMYYYPTEWANTSSDELKLLSDQTKKKLLSRLSNIKKGPWKHFRTLLEKNK